MKYFNILERDFSYDRLIKYHKDAKNAANLLIINFD